MSPRPGQKVPTTSPAAGGSSESAVSVVPRPLPQTVRTRASSAATNKRDLSAQGRRRPSPLAPLLALPAPPRAKSRPSPSRRKEHGFTVGRRHSGRVGAIEIDPESETDYDEEDIEQDAWLASVVMESKVTDIPAETIQVRRLYHQ